MGRGMAILAIVSMLQTGIVAQGSPEKSLKEMAEEWANEEGSLSANLRRLKKASSQYLVVNETIYTTDDAVLDGLYSFTRWPIYWSIQKWVIEGDSIKMIGKVMVDYNFRGYNSGINKFKIKVEDGYIVWRKRFTGRRVRGRFPSAMIDKGGKIKIQDICNKE